MGKQKATRLPQSFAPTYRKLALNAIISCCRFALFMLWSACRRCVQFFTIFSKFSFKAKLKVVDNFWSSKNENSLEEEKFYEFWLIVHVHFLACLLCGQFFKGKFNIRRKSFKNAWKICQFWHPLLRVNEKKKSWSCQFPFSI